MPGRHSTGLWARLVPIARPARALCLLLLTLPLGGCLYYRLVQTYSQLCAERPRISVQALAGGGRVLVFDEPTLYDSDVECLMGAAPSRIESTGLGQRWVYVGTPAGSDRAEERAIRVELSFVRVDDRQRLSRATLPPQLERVLSQRLIDQAIEAACAGRLDPMTKTAEVDLSGIDRSELPRRPEVIALLGDPQGAGSGHTELSYAYCLGRCMVDEPEQLMGRIDIGFDGSGRIEQAIVDYLQYSAEADFLGERAVVAFRGSIAGLAWDCGP